MTENNYGSQPEKQLSPEEQLDLLLEKFLNDPNNEIPTVEDLMPKQEALEDTASLPETETDDRFESLWEDSDVTEDPEDITPMAELEPLDEAEFADFMESQAEAPAEESEPLEEAIEGDAVEEVAAAPETEDNRIIPVVFFPEADLQQEEYEEAAEAPEEEPLIEDPNEEEIAEGEDSADKKSDSDRILPVFSFPEEEETQEAARAEATENTAEVPQEEETAEEEIVEVDESTEEEDYDTLAPVMVFPREDETPEADAEEDAAETAAKEEAPKEEETQNTADETTEDDSPVPVMIFSEDEEPQEAQDEETAENIEKDPADENPAEEEIDGKENGEEQVVEEKEYSDDVPDPRMILPEETEAQEESAEEIAEETAEPQTEEVSNINDNAVPAPQPAPVMAQVSPQEEDEEDWDDEDWDDEEDDWEEEDDQPLPPPKKRRPKNNKKYGFFGIPHILTTFVWLGIIVFIGVGLGQLIWNCAADVLALGREDSEVAITIDEADDLKTVANKLHTLGLIRYPSLFVIYGDISDAMESIRVGSYTLNTLYDYHALVDAMSSNQRRITTNVTIPEGYTCAQIFKLLETKGISTVAKLEAAAINGELGDYWFLEGVEQNAANCLEGFLFPDTYTFYLDHDPVGVLKKFLDNFNKRFNESMQIKLDTLNATLSEKMRANGLSEEYIAEHQMTVRDIVIIASMIEKETASAPESYNISSVIYNRLADPDNYPYLNIDAALVYVLGHGDLTMEDLQFDSPYNTYLYPGLIPGAIANPGSYSLDAALDPTQTDYYFYALNPSTGEHHFSKTLKEHNDFLDSIRKEDEPEDTEE